MAVVVITGASSGLGEAMARALAKDKHSLVLAARRVERLQQLAAELTASTSIHVVPTDVTQPEQIEHLAAQAVHRFTRIDVWINNAGIGHDEPWWEADVDSIKHAFDVNMGAVWMGSRVAIRQMLQQGSGHIINIASVAGHIGGTAVYSGTKFGVRGFSEGLRRELRRHNIKVSIVSPGFIRTDMTAALKFPMPPPEIIGRAVARLIRHPRREVVVPRWYRLPIVFNSLVPGLVDIASGGIHKQEK